MVDARGLSCPMPVYMVQSEVKKNQPALLEVLLDSEVAVENVKRYAASQGYAVTVEESGEDTKLTLKK